MMLRITDKTFHYTNSDNTDIRKRFKRMERERKQREAELEAKRKAAEEAAKAEQVGKVRQLKGAK